MHLTYLNIKTDFFCYFQNTFHFVSMSRQTDDIGKKLPKQFVEQSIGPIVHTQTCGECNINYSQVRYSKGSWVLADFQVL